MLLGVAQLNVDLHTNAETAKLSFLKSGAFYLAGKLSWAAMEISVIGVGFVDLALTKIGQSALGAKQRVLQSAFYNYHEKGPGRMTYKQWYAYLREQNVRSTEEMYAAIRKKLRVFWTKGQVHVRDYADMRQVKDQTGLVDRFFLDLTSAFSGFGWQSRDEEAVMDAYMRERLLPYLHTFFSKY